MFEKVIVCIVSRIIIIFLEKDLLCSMILSFTDSNRIFFLYIETA